MFSVNSKVKSIGASIAFAGAALAMPSLAFAAGGLDEGKQALDAFRIWAYSILAIICLIYIMYKVVMALFEKHQWADVVQGLIYCAVAGGIMAAADFFWSIWGSGMSV